MTEKIGVLIPTFNREKYIEISINSILQQTYSNLEIIIYDDGSNDNTIPIIKKLMKQDKRIILIEGKINKGVSYARNRLLEKCTTKYACWHDSDDISHGDRISLQYHEMKKHDKLIFTKWCWLHAHKGGWVKRYSTATAKAFATLLFPIEKKITFNEILKVGGEDWDWIKKMKEKYFEVDVSKVLYYVRYHEDRIGTWKRKLRKSLPKELLTKLSYKELIEYYKKHYE